MTSPAELRTCSICRASRNGRLHRVLHGIPGRNMARCLSIDIQSAVIPAPASGPPGLAGIRRPQRSTVRGLALDHVCVSRRLGHPGCRVAPRAGRTAGREREARRAGVSTSTPPQCDGGGGGCRPARARASVISRPPLHGFAGLGRTRPVRTRGSSRRSSGSTWMARQHRVHVRSVRSSTGGRSRPPASGVLAPGS